MCESKDLLVGYVYDDMSAGERQTLQAHLAGCGECRAELDGLRATRTHLAQWSPPEPDLGFRLIRGGSAPAPALPRRMRLAPAIAFAAAAVIVLAVAAAIANIEVRYGSDGVVVRTGWAPPATQGDLGQPDPVQADPATASAAVPAAGSADFAELDRRLREIEMAVAAPSETGTQLADSTGPRMSDAEMLRRVRQIVSDAESRQQTAVARQLLQVIRDFDQKRRTDIAFIQQGLEQYQGLTNANIAQNRDIVNQLVRASTRQEK